MGRGVSNDLEFVCAFEHEVARAQLERARGQLNAFSALARRLASARPSEHERESTFRPLQEQARSLLATPQIELSAVGAELRDGARP
jgi:polysaccharide deacetylase 2 family uncharacterized protein YibQ